LVKQPDGVPKVTNERPAVGGTNEQKVNDLKAQVPKKLRSRERAVTAEDYKFLAEQAGGVNRATAIPLAHPNYRDIDVPGAVTVVIVPDTGDYPPTPSHDLIRAVGHYLEQFRTLTTELYVTGPAYRAIKVEATLIADTRYAFDGIKAEVIKQINRVLDPVKRGPQGTVAPAQNAGSTSAPVVKSATGARSTEANRDEQQPWDFGQTFYPTGLYGKIMAVPGVISVENLAILVDGKPHGELTDAVEIKRDELLYGVVDHNIVVVATRNS
jgi:hypothetical protein